MKIRELFVVFVILLIIGTLFSAFLVKSIESDTGAVHVWNLKVWVVDNTLDMMSENISYLWQVRSAFENSGRVYVAYYTPVSIVSNTGFIYNAEDSKKDDDFYSKAPFYLVYNEKISQFTYLNAKKEILQGNNDFNKDLLKILDTSNVVKIGRLNFTTSFDLTRYDERHRVLFKQFNDYLNSQISK